MGLPLLLVFLFLAGILGGLLGSLSGLGGGVVLVPVLVIAFQVPLVDAIGASAVSVLATSTTTGAAYVGDRLTDVRIGMFLEIATDPGALIGVAATLLLARAGLSSLLLIVLGAVLLATLPGSLHRAASTGPRSLPDARATRLGLSGSYWDAHLGREVDYGATRTTPALGTMFAAGAVSGMFGIGSGVLKVLAMERFLGLPLKVATATSNFMIGVTVALGTVAGSFVGSRILPGTSTERLRTIFLVVVAVIGLELILRGVGLP